MEKWSIRQEVMEKCSMKGSHAEISCNHMHGLRKISETDDGSILIIMERYPRKMVVWVLIELANRVADGICYGHGVFIIRDDLS